jgi:hypothetical protein
LLAVVPVIGTTIAFLIKRLSAKRHDDDETERYGIDAKLFEWEPEADCPPKRAGNLYDQCGADG